MGLAMKGQATVRSHKGSVWRGDTTSGYPTPKTKTPQFSVRSTQNTDLWLVAALARMPPLNADQHARPRRHHQPHQEDCCTRGRGENGEEKGMPDDNDNRPKSAQGATRSMTGATRNHTKARSRLTCPNDGRGGNRCGVADQRHKGRRGRHHRDRAVL